MWLSGWRRGTGAARTAGARSEGTGPGSRGRQTVSSCCRSSPWCPGWGSLAGKVSPSRIMMYYDVIIAIVHLLILIFVSRFSFDYVLFSFFLNFKKASKGGPETRNRVQFRVGLLMNFPRNVPCSNLEMIPPGSMGSIGGKTKQNNEKHMSMNKAGKWKKTWKKVTNMEETLREQKQTKARVENGGERRKSRRKKWEKGKTTKETMETYWKQWRKMGENAGKQMEEQIGKNMDQSLQRLWGQWRKCTEKQGTSLIKRKVNKNNGRLRNILNQQVDGLKRAEKQDTHMWGSMLWLITQYGVPSLFHRLKCQVADAWLLLLPSQVFNVTLHTCTIWLPIVTV